MRGGDVALLAKQIEEPFIGRYLAGSDDDGGEIAIEHRDTVNFWRGFQLLKPCI
jgi:hypothetical protein